jgi:ribonuclease HI
MNEIVIYTDGGCSGNPGPGGWGTVILYNGKEICLSGGEKNTTNNRMELMAAITALEQVNNNEEWKNADVSVYSDSQYVKNGITTWIKNWKIKGWKTAEKKPVKNQDLWVKLDSLASSIPSLEWKWVKGHAGIKYNEMCDTLAGQEIEKHR